LQHINTATIEVLGRFYDSTKALVRPLQARTPYELDSATA
jgi:hypothetical protein